MTPNEHLLILFSIVLGLGLAELLSSFHNLLHPSTRTKWHWLPAYWAWSAFASIVFWWWVMFNFTQIELLPNFFGIMLILLGPVFLYLMATSVLPDITPGESVDLRAFYMANRRRFFGFAAAYTLVVWAQIPAFGWDVPPATHVWGAAAFVQLVALASTTNTLVHVLLTILNALMFAASIAAYWFRIA